MLLQKPHITFPTFIETIRFEPLWSHGNGRVIGMGNRVVWCVGSLHNFCDCGCSHSNSHNAQSCSLVLFPLSHNSNNDIPIIPPATVLRALLNTDPYHGIGGRSGQRGESLRTDPVGVARHHPTNQVSPASGSMSTEEDLSSLLDKADLKAAASGSWLIQQIKEAATEVN